MLDDIHYRLGDALHRRGEIEQSEHRLRWPETGGIKILLEVALVYHLVAVATPVLIEQIELLHPAVVPDPFTTALYALVWLGVGGVLVWLFASESLLSTHRFDEYDDVERYLEDESPDRRWFLVNGGLAVSGSVFGWITYERFVVAFLQIVDLLVIVVDEFEWALGLSDGVYVAGFLGGFLLFATGVDRLVVGGLRRYIRRRREPN